MEIVKEIFSPILSKIGEILMDPVQNQVRYLCCFKSIVQGLREEEENLKLLQDRIKQQVKIAIRNAEVIEEDVQKWLTEVRNAVADVDELEEEIQVNKRCLGGRCPNWIWRYRLSKKAEGKRNNMSKLRNDGKFEKVSHRDADLPGIEFLAAKDFELFESSKLAFDQIMEALKDDDDSICIIGLYGMEGVGKTTLAEAVGYKAKEEKIFDEVILVNVSQNSVENIQDQVAESLSLKLEEKAQVRRAERLYLRFTKLENKYLIILDDVPKKFDLKTTIGISIDGGCKRCKILLTTRLEQVCNRMKCQRKIQLNVLTEKEGLALFKHHASIDDSCHDLNAMAIDIARECKGLPSALVTLGSALKDKGVDEWKVMLQRVKKSKLVDLSKVVSFQE